MDDRSFEGIPEAEAIELENAADVALTPAEAVEYDVETLQPADDAPGLLFGPPASLKTWIAMHLCDAIATGQPFLGRYAVRPRCKAIYLNVDAGVKTFRNRVRRLSNAPGFMFLSIPSGRFSPTMLHQILAANEGAFVVQDCLSAIFRPDPRLQNPETAMRDFVDGQRALFAQYGCGGLIIDHPHRPKDKGELGDYFGSIQKEAAFRVMWQVTAEPPDESGGPRRVKISCRKISEGEPFSPVTALVDFGAERVAFTTTDSASSSTDQLDQKVIAWGLRQIEAFSKTTLEKANIGIRASDLRASFDRLVDRGIVAPTGARRGGGNLYRVITPSASGTERDEPDGLGSLSQNDQSVPSPFFKGTDWSGTDSDGVVSFQPRDSRGMDR